MIFSHPWFCGAILLTLALGIGLNTMVFTLVNAALVKPVPLPGGDRLVAIGNRNLSQGNSHMGVSYRDFREYQAQNSSFEALEAASSVRVVISEQGNPPERYRLDHISSGLFPALHMNPILGRSFLASDDKAGAEPVVMLSYGVWRDRYAGSRSVVGRAVRVNDKPATIIGVMPEGFKFPTEEDAWMPLQPTPELENRSHRTLSIFGILKPGVSIPQARLDLDNIARRLAAQYPEADKNVGVYVDTFHEHYNGGPIKMVFILMLAAVTCVLLVVCANVANMMLSRGVLREREMSIRAAIGASRWQVVRQLLIESLLLSGFGGALGLGLAAAGVKWFDGATQGVGKPYWVQFTMDYRVFAYFAAACIVSGLLFGLAPAFRSAHVDPHNALKEGARSIGSRRGGHLAGVLVVLQFALTAVLLTGAGVFVRSFLAGQSMNHWMPADHLLTGGINLPNEHYADAETRVRFFEQLQPKLERIPGVRSASFVSDLPGMGAGERHIEIEHTSLTDASHGPSATVVVEYPEYFKTMNLPMLLGRNFDAMDGMAGRKCAVVTKEFAERHWHRQAAIDKRFRFYQDGKPGEWLTIIGVSANVEQWTDRTSAGPVVFLPYRQEGYNSMAIVLRTAGDPTVAASGLRNAVQSLDPELPVTELRTMNQATEHQQWYLRLFSKVFGAFALISLLIAAVGIYAVMAQATGSRTQEIGVRMALGASARSILGLVLRRGFIQLVVGLAIGLACAVPAARVMATLPIRFSASDPLLFLAVMALLGAAGLLACWLPARRAAAVNPVEAIRYE